MEDCENEVANGVKEEDESIARFNEQKGSAEGLIASLEEKKTNLESDKADRDSKIGDEESVQEDTEALLFGREEELAAMKPNCDFILANYDLRHKRRKAETQGLFDARNQLSGMAGASNHGFMQVEEHSFDDSSFGKLS